MSKPKFINIAVIAHVDAGKSTLVDALLKQSGVFRDNENIPTQVMDSNDLERERGITIYAKNCSIMYNDIKINIIDTPGHADFSSEIERIIKTTDVVILLVDSAEGPMPQTRFVLKKSLEIGLNPILFINKIDKKEARVEEVIEEVVSVFLELNASNEQLEFPVLYGIARDGIAIKNMNDKQENLMPLLETIVSHHEIYSQEKQEEPLRLQISTLGYDNFIGSLGIGRIFSGVIKVNEEIALVANDGSITKNRIKNLFVYQGIKRVPVEKAYAGDIVVVAGIDNISIGDTICDKENINPMPPIVIEEPTLSMNFIINNSPFVGTEGKYVTTKAIKERLEKELKINVGLRLEPLEDTTIEGYKVLGRGELHLSILIENMRRENYELAISKPQVIMKTNENGQKTEPIEQVIMDVPTEYASTVINNLQLRKGIMLDMNSDGAWDRLTFEVPTRGLIGFRRDFTNITRGEGILIRIFDRYDLYKGAISNRQNGVFISMTNGESTPYALNSLEPRGKLFIGPKVKVYEGMIVGLHNRDNDLEVNPCRPKQLTNIRSSGNDDAIRLSPPVIFTLEEALEFIDNDELVEVTPLNIRLRKRFLKANERKNKKMNS